METNTLILSATSFMILAVIGIIVPVRISKYFGNVSATPDQINELRAVYGGLPLALAFIGFACLIFDMPIKPSGMLFMYAAILYGMVLARIFSICLERPTRRTYGFLIAELCVGSISLYGFLA